MKFSLLTDFAAFHIVAVSISTVADAVAPYKLLPLPTNDTSLFPNGFPADKFPVLIYIYYDNDIRMSSLQLPKALLAGAIIVPFVDRLSDGKTRFSYSVKNYIGGVNGDSISPYVPAIVGSLEGTTLYIADFDPDNAPYMQIATSPAEYIAQVKNVVVPNPVSGPGVYLEAIDMDFFTAETSDFTEHSFHEVINQPLILTSGMCQRNPIYFNQTFTNPTFRNGKVILYDSPASAFPGVYTGVAGYSASGEMVGYNSESCSDAAKNADPKARA